MDWRANTKARWASHLHYLLGVFLGGFFTIGSTEWWEPLVFTLIVLVWLLAFDVVAFLMYRHLQKKKDLIITRAKVLNTLDRNNGKI